MFVLNLSFMVLVCIYTLIGKKKGFVLFGNLCVQPDQQCDVSVSTLNIVWMAITCQSAGDNDDFHLANITSGKH